MAIRCKYCNKELYALGIHSCKYSYLSRTWRRRIIGRAGSKRLLRLK